LEGAILRAADELVHEGVISGSTWTVLSNELDSQQILDLIFTVGVYEMLAWMMRSVELELEDDFRTVTEPPATLPS
jgi:hypothetical protein